MYMDGLRQKAPAYHTHPPAQRVVDTLLQAQHSGLHAVAALLQGGLQPGGRGCTARWQSDEGLRGRHTMSPTSSAAEVPYMQC